MRACAKVRCSSAAAAGVSVRYADRLVTVQPLLPAPDPGVLDLCEEHIARLVPPLGWQIRDLRELPAAVGS